MLVIFHNFYFRFYSYEVFFGYLSTFFGSTCMYLYLIPIMSALHTKLYHKILISCIANDFLNLMLKWILSEDRPYWWIHESTAYTSLTRPTLYQTERTCETSPGSPSGHMMMAGCFMYLVYDEINLQIDKNVAFGKSIIWKIINRTFLLLILTATAISRMYFSNHFLHQCILGCMTGMVVAIVMTKGNISAIILKFERQMWISTVLSMIISVFAIFWTHKLISGNPMASVHLAFKYCQDPLYPKPETTVVFTALRSIALACGILLNAPLYKR